MKEFVLRVLHVLVYAFELLLHKTKRKVTEDKSYRKTVDKEEEYDEDRKDDTKRSS